MATQLQELTAVFLGKRPGCQWPEPDEQSATIIGDVHVNGEVNERMAIKGRIDLQADSAFTLAQHVRYRFYGKWTSYENKRANITEKQFHFNSFVVAEQHDRKSVCRYLEAAGAGYGFGAARAGALFDKFGGSAVRILRETPEVAEAALREAGKRVSLDSLKKVAAVLQRDAKIEDTLLELNGLLRGKGFPRDLPKDLIRSKGAKASHFIKTNPFGLLVDGYRGCGFKKCDALYQSLGLPLDDLKRQMLCAWHAMRKDRSGSTWFPEAFASQAIKQNVGGADISTDKAIALGIRSGWMTRVHTETVSGPIVPSDSPEARMSWIAEGRNAANERLIAEKLAQLALSPNQWPDVAGVKNVSDHQRAALAAALKCPVATLIGGPGTGKSHTTANFIELLIRTFGEENILVAAPTNKAAVRLTSALRSYDLPLVAVSEHRLLGVDNVSGGTWKFRHDERQPLRAKVLLLDESSMRSLSMFASILRACPLGMHIFLVGDTLQLPPIDSGAPFRDMLASKVLPFGELTEPQRNAGDIVFACDDIRQGRPFRQSEKIDLNSQPPANFKFIGADSPEAQIDKLTKLIAWMQKEGYDPVWDCQVMVAVNKSSPVARIPLNQLLQKTLNAGGTGPKGATYLTGDKVVCEENGMYGQVDEKGRNNGKGQLFVAKGEFGQVMLSEANRVVVRYEGRKELVVVPVKNGGAAGKGDDEENAASVEESNEGENEEAGAKLSLAYACTTHKAQGAEFKIAVPMIDESKGAKGIMTREHFYTSISRGKLLTLPIGKEETAQDCCRRSALVNRKTFLSELIREKIVSRQVEELV